MASRAAVGDEASSLGMYSLWGDPSMQVLDLICWSLFSFRKMSVLRALFFSSGLGDSVCLVINAYMSCIWRISFVVLVFALLPHSLIP